MERIDSHQHYWLYNRNKHAWINDDMSVIRRDFLPQTSSAIMLENDIAGIIAVQADQSEAETDFLIDLASKNDIIKGVVGWVDLRADNIRERLSHYAEFPVVKGFRHVVQEEPDPDFMLGRHFTRGIALLQEYDFTYDILIFPKQLDASIGLVEMFPAQKFVLDHIAKPPIKDGGINEWEAKIRSLAGYGNVSCKVSGMITEADWKSWKYEDFVPYLDVIFDAFGVNRIMFGSDFPVSKVAGEYGAVVEIIERYTASFTEEEKAGIWRDNARKFYRI